MATFLNLFVIETDLDIGFHLVKKSVPVNNADFFQRVHSDF